MANWTTNVTPVWITPSFGQPSDLAQYQRSATYDDRLRQAINEVVETDEERMAREEYESLSPVQRLFVEEPLKKK